METETQTRPGPELAPPDPWKRDNDDAVARLTVHSGPRNASTVHLRADELQVIVQAAYDQHGILATPSYATEAAR